MEFEMNK